MNRWWPSEVPFRLRVFFRGSFLLLALATLALAAFELREEKAMSYRSYRQLFDRNSQQIIARLQHPSGQLALLNPTLRGSLTPIRPLLLPFSAIDFDDKAKAQQAAEMAGCLVQYPKHAQLCVSVGNNPVAGGFIYAVGTFASGALTTHRLGDLDLTHAHRLRIEVALRGRRYRWIAPLESEDSRAHLKFSGRLAGFTIESDGRTADRPGKGFRGWLWQDGRCLEPADAGGECLKRSFYSVRLPMDLFHEELFDRPAMIWPPKDLAQVQVHLQVFEPGDGPPLFDSDRPGASAPFALSDLKAQLLPGQTLRIRRLDVEQSNDVIALVDNSDQPPLSHPLDHLIASLPVQSGDRPLTARQIIATPVGDFEVLLQGDPHSVDRSLNLLAGRQSLFVAAMLLAILLTWAAIELRIIHRITLLTRRAAGLKLSTEPGESLRLELQGLTGRDELGLLAGVLSDLLQRINEDAHRERLRVEQEKNMWHAVGHEIMSPLQSLSALHDSPDDESLRYVNRMRQAVRILYGSASPSDAILSASLQMNNLDIQSFLQTVADNAAEAGIAAPVTFDGIATPLFVKADEYSLEDVVTHVLTNADRYRSDRSAIRMSLRCRAKVAEVRIHNYGSRINPSMLEKIFEYGVSEANESERAPLGTHRGQGLFVAKTYMAKMGGTIEAANVTDGVEFVLRLAVA
jgi:signal transduction histidine kinase